MSQTARAVQEAIDCQAVFLCMFCEILPLACKLVVGPAWFAIAGPFHHRLLASGRISPDGSVGLVLDIHFCILVFTRKIAVLGADFTSSCKRL